DRGPFRQLQWRDRLLADGVGILPGDAEQIAVDEHRVAAAQRLGDVAGAADRKGDVVALGAHDGGAVALETDRFTAAGIHHSRIAGRRNRSRTILVQYPCHGVPAMLWRLPPGQSRMPPSRPRGTRPTWLPLSMFLLLLGMAGFI